MTIHIGQNEEKSNKLSEGEEEQIQKEFEICEREEKKSVDRVCIRSFSCNYHSCIAVTENDQIFIWGRCMQGIDFVPNGQENVHEALFKPKYVETSGKRIKVFADS